MDDLAGSWTVVDDTGAWRCAMALPGDNVSALA